LARVLHNINCNPEKKTKLVRHLGIHGKVAYMKSSKIKIFAFVLAVISLGIVLSGQSSYATSTEIFNNFGPPDDTTYKQALGNPGWLIGPGNTQAPAMSFTVFLDSYKLDTIQIALTGTNVDVRVELRSDIGGVPNTTAIESWDLTINIGNTATNSPLTLNSAGFALIENNKYWVMASTTALDRSATWNANSVGQTGGLHLSNGSVWGYSPQDRCFSGHRNSGSRTHHNALSCTKSGWVGRSEE
jgi:hypothetical protein